MELVTIGLLLALEALVLLAALVVVLARRQRNLRRQLEQLSERDQAEPGFASVESGYLAFLEKQIVDTRARLELGEAETAADGGFLEALSSRLVLLESEKKVAELCNDYPARRWEHIRACFVPFIDQPEAGAPAPDGDGDDGKLQRARQRIQALEKFRGHFFSVNKQLKELEATRQKIVEQLELARLLLVFVLRRDRDVVVIDAQTFSCRAKILMVTDDQRNLDAPFTRLVTRQDVVEAV